MKRTVPIHRDRAAGPHARLPLDAGSLVGAAVAREGENARIFQRLSGGLRSFRAFSQTAAQAGYNAASTRARA
jgi:hypothetical protein